MAETITKNQICDACGADVRKDALFCYNCGGAISAEVIGEENYPKDKVSNVWLRENIVENGNHDKKIESPQDEEKEPSSVAIKEETPKPKTDIRTEDKLKSAASMRRKSATYQKEKIEVSWEEYEDKTNGWFVITAIILTIFTVGILLLAFYLN